MSINVASAWTFPSPANARYLHGAHLDANSFNTNSMIEYLKSFTRFPPRGGFGSKPVYVKDTIELSGGPGLYDIWCLQCKGQNSGPNSWDACEAFTRNSSLTLSQEMIINETNIFVSMKQSEEVSVSICAFAKSDPVTDAYNLTVAYPSINTERDDGSIYTFSQAAPAGRRNLGRTLRTGGRWETETVLTSSPRQHIEKRKGGGRGGNGGFVASGGGGPSTGAIIGIVLGVAVIFLICVAIGIYIFRRERKKKNVNDEKGSIRSFPYEATETGAAPTHFTPNMPYNPPATAPPPYTSTTEQGNLHCEPIHDDARLGSGNAIYGAHLSARDPSRERTSESHDEAPLLKQDALGYKPPTDKRRLSF